MKCFITYCSKQKSDAKEILPAIKRYQSARIKKTMHTAYKEGASFLILSGKFGLLGPEDPIPWYDHLLSPSEVPAMVNRIADELKSYSEIVFCHSRGDHIAPYLATIKEASARAELKMSIRLID